jgi:hypothetical protein
MSDIQFKPRDIAYQEVIGTFDAWKQATEQNDERYYTTLKFQTVLFPFFPYEKRNLYSEKIFPVVRIQFFHDIY